MSRSIISLILVLCFAASFGQNQKGSKTDTSQMARITFEKTIHDFKTIPREGSVSCTFTFTNTGKSPLILSDVKPRCGCTTAKWSKEPVKPGLSGEITVKYTPDHRGDFMQEITVKSNAVTSNVIIYAKGVIK